MFPTICSDSDEKNLNKSTPIEWILFKRENHGLS